MAAATTDPRHNHPVILELRALRRGVAESEWAFFSGAKAAEERPERWRGDFATFDALLDFGNIEKPHRYRNWCRAVQEFTEATVRVIGIDAAIQLVRSAPPPAVRDEAVQHFTLSHQTNGVPVSEQQSRAVLNRLDTREKRSGLVAAHEKEESFRQTAIRLQRRVRELEGLLEEAEKQIAALKKDNAALRERLGESGTVKGVARATARKPAPNHAKGVTS